MNITFRPLESFPGKRPPLRRSKFNTSYSKTLSLLERELCHLNAQQVVISLDCDSREIRNDGMPRSDCRPRSPAVVLSFDSRKSGPMQFPCAAFHDWQDNVRAIALSLEALRQVDRYGVTQSAEQYRGWAKLPGPTQPSPLSLHEAASVIVTFSGGGDANLLIRSVDAYRDSVKQAQVATHPDKNGGQDGQFKAIQAARAILDRHHGI